MKLAERLERKIDRSPPPHISTRDDPTGTGQLGTGSGLNRRPGSDDDGWVVPDPVTLADGTTLQLYKDGEGLRAAYDAIKAATYRVCLEVYIFASDDTGRAFANLLMGKAREGLQVYVIYDSFGSIDSDPQMFAQMKRAGVRVAEFSPIRPWDCTYSWRPVNRDHRKLLFIDSDIAGVGGLNVGHQYAGSWVVQRDGEDECELWRDNAVGIVGPSAKPLLRSFAKTWAYCQKGGPVRRAEFIHNIEVGGVKTLGKKRIESVAGSKRPAPPASPKLDELGVLASVPTLGSPLRPLLYRLVRNARRSINLTMAYFAPDDELIDELRGAARRGVRVRLMLPGRTDVWMLHIAAQSFYETLMAAGVEVYERQAVVLHAKTMVIDGQLSILGSTNLDYRSVEYNCELSVVIQSAKFGRQMQDLFENDICYARRIILDQWRRRPRWDRFVQWAISRARYLL